jgi:hypothetical protein
MYSIYLSAKSEVSHCEPSSLLEYKTQQNVQLYMLKCKTHTSTYLQGNKNYLKVLKV